MPDAVPRLLRGLRKNHFPEIVADVPWRFVVRSKRGLTSRSPESKYQTMTLSEIAALPVKRYAAGNARLWFWVTGPFLAVGAHIPIMRAWGFEPVAMAFDWIKPVASIFDQGQLFIDASIFKMGNGYTTRKNAEYVILGRRGTPPPRLRRDVRALLVEPAREHSSKPEAFYRSIEAYAAGPYLELFGRRRRPGWTVRGDQIGVFDDSKAT